MATKSSASTTEYSLMVRSTSALVNAIKQSPQEIGLELFAGDLFSEEDRDFVCESSESKMRKAIRVVNVVTDRTKHNSNVLAQFVEVLKKAGRWTNDAVELLTTTPVLEVVIDDESVVAKPARPAMNASTDSLNMYDLIDTTSPLPTSFKLSERDLTDETLKIKGEFAGLIVNVVESMQEVRIEALVRFLAEIEAVKSVTVAARKSIVVFEQEQLKFSTIDEVFDFLRGYYSWFNYGLIELILDAFCSRDKNVTHRLKVYKASMEAYCRHRLSRVPMEIGFGHKMKGSRTFSFKIDEKWNSMKINQIRAATAIIAKTLNLKHVALYLRTVQKGCVKLTYDIPVRVQTAIFPPSCESLLELQKHKITLQEAPIVKHPDVIKLNSFLQVKERDFRRPSHTESGFDGSPDFSRKGSSASADMFEIPDPLDQSMSKESGFGSPSMTTKKSRCVSKESGSESPLMATMKNRIQDNEQDEVFI